ncbi:hypothetical protein RHMOL_Rhmol03G0144800 [Rhododendron molle]|uniref:Uncharacterized protein n=1 Tax=Rhododendron molle TaxID=49168 RepID=A0ACC0PE98_RHOML|nr:hypothetical protein RHMOL_Rhmol03G0144800 [Rhododendron molle]
MPTLNDLTKSISMYLIAKLTPNITAPNSLTVILTPLMPLPSLESRISVVVVGAVEEEEEGRGGCLRERREWEMEMNHVKWKEMNVGDGDDGDKRGSDVDMRCRG